VKASEIIHKTSTASAQKSNIVFRPLPQYDQTEIQAPIINSAEPFITTSQLELSVPDAVSQPTLDWKYLSRTYTLSLALHFRGTQGAPSYSVNTTISLSVTAYGSKADDAVHGHVAMDCLEASSDADEEDALLELLGPLRAGQEQPQTQQRVSRTPPPPYFR